MIDFFLYNSEKEAINNFIVKHSHIQPNNIAPYKYTISFNETSVVTIPTIKCWCGEEENISCDERWESI